jgi:EAL domain-containing protein (putative c-di-GMP-specific phosphodiesterase class I)
VEITETQIMENPESVSDVLKTLNTAGTRIAIDDFGKGYSSLSYLATLPAQILKIDQSFIVELGKCGKNTAIVRAILSLGDCLGLEVIAEGVETEEQLRHLRELKCKHAQGYYFARPMEPKTAAWFIGRSTVVKGTPVWSGDRST